MIWEYKVRSELKPWLEEVGHTLFSSFDRRFVAKLVAMTAYAFSVLGSVDAARLWWRCWKNVRRAYDENRSRLCEEWLLSIWFSLSFELCCKSASEYFQVS